MELTAALAGVLAVSSVVPPTTHYWHYPRNTFRSGCLGQELYRLRLHAYGAVCMRIYSSSIAGSDARGARWRREANLAVYQGRVFNILNEHCNNVNSKAAL